MTPPLGFVLVNGRPGDTWVNTTGRVAYQFLADLQNTCGVCLQYHMAVGNSWPIPLHHNCRCKQVAVYPGDESRPFVDFREVLRDLPDPQKAAAVGAANYRLLSDGLVEWSDVVTEGRVRDLREVVSRKRLTVKAMTAAGVPQSVAVEAHKAVHTAAHTLAQESRRRIVEALRKKGVTATESRRAVAERLAARVSVGKGPSGPQPPPVTPAPVRPLTPVELGERLGIKLKPVPPAAAAPKGEATRQELEALRAEVRAATGPDVRRAAVARWLRQRMTADATPKRVHGMTDPEGLHLLRVDGIDWFSPPLPPPPDPAAAAKHRDEVARGEEQARSLRLKLDSLTRERDELIARHGAPGAKVPDVVASLVYGLQNRIDRAAARLDAAAAEVARLEGEAEGRGLGSHPFVETLRGLLEGADLPRPLTDATRSVVFSVQKNRADDDWAARYKTPGFTALATGGDGGVVVYNGRPISPPNLAHEMGHNLASLRYGFTNPRPGSDFAKAAATGEPPPTDYGANSPSEDFAESVRLYHDNPGRLRTIAPERFRVIERLMTDPGYGG